MNDIMRRRFYGSDTTVSGFIVSTPQIACTDETRHQSEVLHTFEHDTRKSYSYLVKVHH